MKVTTATYVSYATTTMITYHAQLAHHNLQHHITNYVTAQPIMPNVQSHMSICDKHMSICEHHIVNMQSICDQHVNIICQYAAVYCDHTLSGGSGLWVQGP